MAKQHNAHIDTWHSHLRLQYRVNRAIGEWWIKRQFGNRKVVHLTNGGKMARQPFVV